MLNRSASLEMSTSVLKALPGKLDIKRHSPSILYFQPMSGSRKFCQGEGGPDDVCLLRISQRTLRTPSRSNWTLWVQLLLERGPLVFLRKYIATCDLPGGVRPCPVRPLHPHMSPFRWYNTCGIRITAISSNTM